MKPVTPRPADDSVDLPERIRRHFNDSAQLKLKAHEVLAEPIAHATQIMVKALLANGKILACGNGGSAPQAPVFSPQLRNPLQRPRPGPAAVHRPPATSTLTSIVEDAAQGQIYSQRVTAQYQP